MGPAASPNGRACDCSPRTLPRRWRDPAQALVPARLGRCDRRPASTLAAGEGSACTDSWTGVPQATADATPSFGRWRDAPASRRRRRVPTCADRPHIAVPARRGDRTRCTPTGASRGGLRVGRVYASHGLRAQPAVNGFPNSYRSPCGCPRRQSPADGTRRRWSAGWAVARPQSNPRPGRRWRRSGRRRYAVRSRRPDPVVGMFAVLDEARPDPDVGLVSRTRPPQMRHGPSVGTMAVPFVLSFARAFLDGTDGYGNGTDGTDGSGLP